MRSCAIWPRIARRRPLTVAEWGGGGYVPGRGGLFDAILTAAGARNVEHGSFGYYDVESLIAANPDALVYGDTYDGTASLRADQDLHPALMQRYAGKRISYAALYGCGVPESADVARQLQDALRARFGHEAEPVAAGADPAGLCRLAAGGAGCGCRRRRCWRRMTALAGLIIYDVRLPRTVLALIVGAVLGLVGRGAAGLHPQSAGRAGAAGRVQWRGAGRGDRDLFRPGGAVAHHRPADGHGGCAVRPAR